MNEREMGIAAWYPRPKEQKDKVEKGK